MDYKEKIIELLDKVKTENTFKRVYKLLEYLYLKEKQLKIAAPMKIGAAF